MIDVIGTDAGAPASLPAPQQKLLRAAALIAVPQRLQAAVREWLGDDLQELISSDDPRALVGSLQSRPAAQPVVVLASGDPLWFGLGRILRDRIGAERLRFHPAPTSLQLAFARIGRPWQDADWVSLHGRDPEILSSALQKRPAALAVLTDPNKGGASTVQRMLRSSGLEASTELWLCENLGHADERVRQIAPGTALPEDMHPLLIALLIAREPAASDPQNLPLFGLDDGLYLQHSDHPGLMTKREVRVQLLAELACLSTACSGIWGRVPAASAWKPCACAHGCNWWQWNGAPEALNSSSAMRNASGSAQQQYWKQTPSRS